jgi:hypothetical protein
MAQILQHVPCIPMLQGLMVTALSNIVSIFSCWALTIISCVAGSMEAATGSATFFGFTAFSFISSAI